METYSFSNVRSPSGGRIVNVFSVRRQNGSDMMAGYKNPLLKPAEVVHAALGSLAAGEVAGLVDDWSRTVKAGLAQNPGIFSARLAANTA